MSKSKTKPPKSSSSTHGLSSEEAENRLLRQWIATNYGRFPDECTGDAFAGLIRRAIKDDKLRQGLLEKPDALLELAGISMPSAQRVRFIEDSADTIYLTLPPKVEASTADDLVELSDDELKSRVNVSFKGDDFNVGDVVLPFHAPNDSDEGDAHNVDG